MKEQLNLLLTYAMSKKTSDIHFYVDKGSLSIQFRTMKGLEKITQDIWKPPLFEYLKFISGFDLTNPFIPQSGKFSWQYKDQEIFCRFSVILNQSIQTGVLRILSAKLDIPIDDLTYDAYAIDCFKKLCHARNGLVLTSGPTNSGKTTTIHALLHEIATHSKYKIVSLEDPIEIEDSNYLQLQINEEQGFTYEKGITELMRHDPDIIFIGEIRNAFCARSLVNAALSGHMVISTIHAGNCLEAIERLLDFGVGINDLKSTLSAMISQRLYTSQQQKKVCTYEIMESETIHEVLETFEYPKEFKTLSKKIMEGIEQGYICDEQAFYDLQNWQK